MSQQGQPTIEYQIARGVNNLNDRVDQLAEAVKKLDMNNDERQMFSQQLADINDEVRQLRNHGGSRERYIKPRKIKPYDGESQTLQSFLTAIELQMENDNVTEDDKKVKYVGNYLEGKAWYWFEPIMREKNTKPKSEWSERTRRILSSFGEMRKAMRQVFGDIDERTAAAQKLQNLRQTRSVREYITEFQTISSSLEWDEEALMDKFKGGLKPNILSLLIYFPTEPEDLEELFERAQKIDREDINARSRTYRNDSTARISYGRQYHGKPTARISYDQQRIKKDRDGDIQMTGAKVDLEKARREKLCFNCGKAGHQARSCRNKQKKPSPRVRMLRAANVTDTSRNRMIIEETEPELTNSDWEESPDSSMIRELISKEFTNLDRDEEQRRQTSQMCDDGIREQPAVLATGFQQIDTEEESDNSWEADEFSNDLQCDRQNELAETISTWKRKVEEATRTRQPPTLRRTKRFNSESSMEHTRKQPEEATVLEGSRGELLALGENEERVDSETPTTARNWVQFRRSGANTDRTIPRKENPLDTARKQQHRPTETDEVNGSEEDNWKSVFATSSTHGVGQSQVKLGADI
jgi:hypothetical protein